MSSNSLSRGEGEGKETRELNMSQEVLSTSGDVVVILFQNENILFSYRAKSSVIFCTIKLNLVGLLCFKNMQSAVELSEGIYLIADILDLLLFNTLWP